MIANRIAALALSASEGSATDAKLVELLSANEPELCRFVIASGLGPIWHRRTRDERFLPSRLQAEALYAAQQQALQVIDACLEAAGIRHAVIKGAANRELLYDHPPVRVCADLDLLVDPSDRRRAVAALQDAGYRVHADALNVSHEITLVGPSINVDLHWGLLRPGRLGCDPVAGMLERRRRVAGQWMLDANDTLFHLLVHRAFVCSVSEAGLHRASDITLWPRRQRVDPQVVWRQLDVAGVKTAAWAVLRWTRIASASQPHPVLIELAQRTAPGPLRRAWLDAWLKAGLSSRLARMHALRLVGLSVFLHDHPAGAINGLRGWWRARSRRRQALADLAR